MWMNLLWWVLAVIVWDFIGWFITVVFVRLRGYDAIVFMTGNSTSLDCLYFTGTILGPFSVIFFLIALL